MKPMMTPTGTGKKTVMMTLGALVLGGVIAIAAPAYAHQGGQQMAGSGQGMMGGGQGQNMMGQGMMGRGHGQGGQGMMGQGMAQSSPRTMPGAATIYSMMKFDDSWSDAAKSQMNIKPEQTDAWNNYIAAAKKISDNARARLKAMNPDDVMAMDVKDRNVFIQSMMKKHMEERQGLNVAREKLVAVLDDKQKAKAGILIPGQMGGRHGGQGMMGGMMGQGMMGQGMMGGGMMCRGHHGMMGQGMMGGGMKGGGQGGNMNAMMSGMMSNMMQMMQMMQNQMNNMQNSGNMMNNAPKKPQ